MSGTLDKLIRQANQIATELENQDRAHAMHATSGHIRDFWDPRMRTQIIAYLEAGGAGLNETARAAIGMLRA